MIDVYKKASTNLNLTELKSLFFHKKRQSHFDPCLKPSIFYLPDDPSGTSIAGGEPAPPPL